MRAVVQRVSRCEVRVADPVAAASAGPATAGSEESGFQVGIGPGLLVYVAVATEDGEEDLGYLVEKIRGLRIFPDDTGRMNRSVQERDGEVLVVSQFTLYGDTRRGRRPWFGRAAGPARAEALYEKLVARLQACGLRVSHGRFRAHMAVAAVNDGPVTILLDSERTF